MDKSNLERRKSETDLPCPNLECGFLQCCPEHPKLIIYEELLSQDLLDKEREFIESETIPSPVECDVCGKQYNNKYKLRDHILIHHSTNLNADVLDTDLKNVISNVNNVCDTIDRHLMTHCLMLITDSKSRAQLNGSTKLSCDTCGKAVTDCLLRTHLLKHVGVWNVECADCLTSFEDGDQFLQHCKEHSAGDKCKVCCQPFEAIMYERECHILQHGVAYPHSCLCCKQQFFSMDEFKHHLKLQHQCESNYCEICDKGFLNNLEYLRHLLTHLKNLCKFCEQCTHVFKSYSSLYNDVLNISIEPMFTCDVCLISFNHYTHLRQHNIQHVVKINACQMCSVSFNRENNLKKHLQMVHAVKFKKRDAPVQDDDEDITKADSILEFEEPCTKIQKKL